MSIEINSENFGFVTLKSRMVAKGPTAFVFSLIVSVGGGGRR